MVLAASRGRSTRRRAVRDDLVTFAGREEMGRFHDSPAIRRRKCGPRRKASMSAGSV
jgi:hypothetical protein